MEIRKIQLTGGSSLSVTLPKLWTDKVRLAAGDVVGCQANPDGSLTVFAHARGERAPQSHRVDHTESEPDFLFRRIIAAYLMGYDTIQVRGKGPLDTATREVVRRAVRRIMGLEIIEEDAQMVTLQDFLDPREFHMEKAIRRMSILTQAMQEEAFANLTDPRRDATASMEDRDDEVDRLYWLINKQFHAMLRDASYAAKMEITPSQGLNCLLAARLIERTADHADRIAGETGKLPEESRDAALLSHLAKEGRTSGALFARAVAVLMKRDIREAHEVIKGAEALHAKQQGLIREAMKLGPEAISHLALIIESIQRTTAYAADIAEVAINHEVASSVPA